MRRWHASEREAREGEGGAIAVLDAGSLPPRPERALAAILGRLGGLPRGGVLKAELPFDPAPILEGLAARGLGAEVAAPEPGLWTLEVRAEGASEILELRDLEAPEPLTRILEACARLAPGASLLARVPRFPRMLLPQLERRGLAWEAYLERDDSALVHVRRPG